jgi:hypothetical protein
MRPAMKSISEFSFMHWAAALLRGLTCLED